MALVALTVKVYSTPFVSPVTSIGLAVPVAVWPPGEAVTVYCVIGLPPSGGAVKLIVARRLPRTAVTPVGAPGGPSGVTEFETPGSPVPALVVAVTEKV
jgi:hypothetical protein